MQHKQNCFTHIKSWAPGLLLLIVLCCAYQPVFARTADFQPARQDADLSNALLRLEDLPKGFAPLSGRELDSMESAVGAIGKQISGATGASLVNFSGFRTGETQNTQIVVSGLITPLSAQLQSTVARAFGNPDLVIRKLKDQLGGDETSELPGYEAIGTTSLGFITNTMGFRMEYVVAQRGPVLIEVANLYRQGEKSLADTIELARLLDNRVADVVGRESGTQFRPAGPYDLCTRGRGGRRACTELDESPAGNLWKMGYPGASGRRELCVSRPVYQGDRPDHRDDFRQSWHF